MRRRKTKRGEPGAPHRVGIADNLACKNDDRGSNDLLRASNDPLMPTGCVELLSVFRFLPPSAVRNEKKNETNTTETAKEELTTEKQPATDGEKPNRGNNKHSAFWKNEVHKMGCDNILAFLKNHIWASAVSNGSGLMALVAIVLRMGGHLEEHGGCSSL
jgi:hypothetical protein